MLYITLAALELSQVLSLRLWAEMAQSVLRLAMGLKVRGSNLGGGARFSAPFQTGPGSNQPPI